MAPPGLLTQGMVQLRGEQASREAAPANSRVKCDPVHLGPKNGLLEARSPDQTASPGWTQLPCPAVEHD
jgi:hypothetical protein